MRVAREGGCAQAARPAHTSLEPSGPAGVAPPRKGGSWALRTNRPRAQQGGAGTLPPFLLLRVTPAPSTLSSVDTGPQQTGRPRGAQLRAQEVALLLLAAQDAVPGCQGRVILFEQPGSVRSVTRAAHCCHREACHGPWTGEWGAGGRQLTPGLLGTTRPAEAPSVAGPRRCAAL